MKKNLRTTLAAFAMLLISVFFAGGLIQSKPEPQKDEKREDLLSVKTSLVEYSSQSGLVAATGRVEAMESVSLSAEVNGKIMAGDIPMQVGQSFQQGDLLIRIYSETAEASLKAARSNYLRSLSNILPDMKVDYPESYSTWMNYFNSIDLDEPLPQIPGFANEKERNFLASKNVLSEYYSIVQQELTYTKYNIYAPFDGYYHSVNRKVGSVAANGSELAFIVRSDILQITTPVVSTETQIIQPGQSVKLKSHSGKIQTGVVSRIAPFVDPTSQSINVYITYQPGKDEPLRVGEYVTAVFEQPHAAFGMQIPREALTDGDFVYIVEDNTLKKLAVNVDLLQNDSAIISGIQEGSAIVVESLLQAQEGQRVVIYRF